MPNYVKNKIHFDCGEEKLKEILESVKFDEIPEVDPIYYGVGTIDFNKLIPMPKSLLIDSGSETDRAIELFLTAINPETKNMGVDKILPEPFERLSKDIHKEMFYGSYRTSLTEDEINEVTRNSSMEKLMKLGETAVTNFARYGATTWYEWSIANWGTKWNSCDPFKDAEGGLEFNTAWSAPHPILEALTNKFPGVYITHEWADEDMGSNCGRREYLNGECVGDYTPQEGKEALDYAFSVWDSDPEDFGLALNKDGSNYVSLYHKYDYIELFGKPALFTSERLTDADIPENTYLYHVRGDDETTGWFAELAPQVLINHFGSIITKDPIDFGTKGYIEFTQETEPKFIGGQIALYKLIDGDCPTEGSEPALTM